MKLFRFLEGFVIGGIIGAAAAMLLAPESGEAFRDQIRQRAETIRGEVQSAAVERRAELEEQLSALRMPRKTA